MNERTNEHGQLLHDDELCKEKMCVECESTAIDRACEDDYREAANAQTII